MKSLFLAALAALALFSSANANAQHYRDSYYYDSNRSAAHLVGALIEVAAHRAHDRRSNYYGGHGYRRDHRYDRYTYAPRYRGYRQHNRYTIYPGYRQHNGYTIYPGYRTRNYHPGYRGRRH